MEDNKPERITKSTKGDKALDAVSFGVSMTSVPVLSGFVNSLLSKYTQDRKSKRVVEFLNGFAEDFEKYKSQAAKEYVKTDEFEELLEQTSKRVAEEISEKKRKAFQSILTNSVKEHGGKYDEKMRFLRCLEDLEEEQLQVLKVLMANPDGIQFPSLDFQLKVMPRERIRDLLFHLSGLGIVDTVRSDGIIALSQFGQRFVQFIMSD